MSRYPAGSHEALELKLARRTVRSEFGCWAWTGATNTAGYGVLLINQHRGGKPKLVTVHRLAFQLANGWLPENGIVHHTCRNKLCVNPKHLEILSKGQHSRLHEPFTRYYSQDS